MLLRATNCRFCHLEIVEDDRVARSAAQSKKDTSFSSSSAAPPLSPPHNGGGDNFVFVQKSHEISQKMDNEVKRRLDAYAQGTLHVSHSLCSKCFDYAMDGLTADGKKLQSKRAVIVASTERLLANAASASSFSTLDAHHPSKARINELKTKQANLERQLAQGERQLTSFKREFLTTQLAQQAELDAQQVHFVDRAIAWRQEKHRDQERQDSLRARFEHGKRELASTASVINDAFFIWEDPPYFSINNMRLGRSFDNEVVEWQELNAAWGEVCLLLYVLARKERYEFKDYVLVPRGRQSLIREANKPHGREFQLFVVCGGAAAASSSSSSSLASSLSMLGGLPVGGGGEAGGGTVDAAAGLLHKLWSSVCATTPSSTSPPPLPASSSSSAQLSDAAAAAAGESSSSSFKRTSHHHNTIANLHSFNQAMVAFLQCLKELGERARDSERGVNLCLKGKLFAIKTSYGASAAAASASSTTPTTTTTAATTALELIDASIAHFSIKTSGDAQDAKRWSEACKYTLTNIKWLCLWSVSHVVAPSASMSSPVTTTTTTTTSKGVV